MRKIFYHYRVVSAKNRKKSQKLIGYKSAIYQKAGGKETYRKRSVEILCLRIEENELFTDKGLFLFIIKAQNI